MIGQNSCLHAVLDIIDPEKQVKVSLRIVLSLK